MKFEPPKLPGFDVQRLRREIQMAFGVSLLGLSSASCIPEQADGDAKYPEVSDRPNPKPHPAPDSKRFPEYDPYVFEVDGGGSTSEPPQEKSEDPPAEAPAPPRSFSTIAIYGDSMWGIGDEVEFSPNSVDIGDEGRRTLLAVKEILDKVPCNIEIVGHFEASERGGRWLSRKRAEKVLKGLITLGAPRARLRIAAANDAAPATGARVTFEFRAAPDRRDPECGR